jgi:hypothetical protein
VSFGKNLKTDMDKPIVFLSHSSRDKEPLAALKKILDDRAAGSLNFFLSSDGESIRLGRNWVVSVSDALSQSKLMFVFLTAHSADSKWIHFEAGCAYAKGIQVVPVCLPGIDLNRITPPLGLLQGFNLHSHEAMGNLARICNETFNMKVNETFSKNDFENAVANIIGLGTGFFGDQAWAIDSIFLYANGNISDKKYNPFPALGGICLNGGMKCYWNTKEQMPSVYNNNMELEAILESPGCQGTYTIHDTTPRRAIQNPPAKTEDPLHQYNLTVTLSPELFHINAPLLDKWIKEEKLSGKVSARIIFRSRIKRVLERHHLTTKLYQCGIDMLGLENNSGFKFDDLTFNLTSRNSQQSIDFAFVDKLEDKRSAIIIEKLFAAGVFWEHEPDLSEMLQGS